MVCSLRSTPVRGVGQVALQGSGESPGPSSWFVLQRCVKVASLTSQCTFTVFHVDEPRRSAVMYRVGEQLLSSNRAKHMENSSPSQRSPAKAISGGASSDLLHSAASCLDPDIPESPQQDEFEVGGGATRFRSLSTADSAATEANMQHRKAEKQRGQHWESKERLVYLKLFASGASDGRGDDVKAGRTR
ncbi:hypothetical protein AOLI_G00156800 [Acnodon oligacanthus]